MRNKRQLYKIEKPKVNEVSVVENGANGLKQWDIIKNYEEAYPMFYQEQSFSEVISERMGEKISNSLWNLFIYTLEDKLHEIHYKDEDKDIKFGMVLELFNEFLINFQENPLIKSEGDKIILKALKTEGGKKYPASSYLYTPDLEKVSTWKLRVYDENGVLDKGLLSAAIASFSPGGFRGNKVILPTDKISSIKSKLRNLWQEAYPDKQIEEMPESIKKEQSPINDNIEQKKVEKMSEKENAFNKAISDLKNIFFPEKIEKSEEPVEVVETEKVSESIEETTEKTIEVEETVEEINETEVVETKTEEVEELAEEIVEEVSEIEKSENNEVIELQKAKEELESELAQLRKEKEESQIALEKAEFIAKAKEEFPMMSGDIIENGEKLYSLSKSLDKEMFEFVCSQFKKASDAVEEMTKETGVSGGNEVVSKEEKQLAEIKKYAEEHNISEEKATYRLLKSKNN